MIEILLERLSYLGMVPLCNGNPARAPWFCGFCFILCYRCLAIIIGVVITLYYLKNHQPKIKYIILIIPMIVDGMFQTFSPYVSNNILRVITGLLFGFGIIQGLFGGLMKISKTVS